MSYFLENLWVSKFKKWIARWFHFLGRYFTNSYLPEQFKLPSSYCIRTEEELYKRVQQDLQKDFEMKNIHLTHLHSTLRNMPGELKLP
jgi:hypothetical protein